MNLEANWSYRFLQIGLWAIQFARPLSDVNWKTAPKGIFRCFEHVFELIINIIAILFGYKIYKIHDLYTGGKKNDIICHWLFPVFLRCELSIDGPILRRFPANQLPVCVDSHAPENLT